MPAGSRSTTSRRSETPGEQPVSTHSVFHPLPVESIEPLTDDSVAITFAVPEDLAGEFDYLRTFSAREWARTYVGKKFDSGELVKAELPVKNAGDFQGFLINLRREKFKDPRVRQAIGLAFDFEWSNRNLFFGQYARTESYFDNSELASEGLPSEAERKLLEPWRGKIPDEQIVVATGDQRGLDDVDLFDPDCQVRIIITKDALKEGWDCSFAYVLCSLTQQRSGTAIMQLLGRVLRMPVRQHEHTGADPHAFGPGGEERQHAEAVPPLERLVGDELPVPRGVQRRVRPLLHRQLPGLGVEHGLALAPGDDERRLGVQLLQVRIELVLGVAAPVVLEGEHLAADEEDLVRAVDGMLRAEPHVDRGELPEPAGEGENPYRGGLCARGARASAGARRIRRGLPPR